MDSRSNRSFDATSGMAAPSAAAVAIAVVLMAITASGQSRTSAPEATEKFEVASIKPNNTIQGPRLCISGLRVGRMQGPRWCRQAGRSHKRWRPHGVVSASLRARYGGPGGRRELHSSDRGGPLAFYFAARIRYDFGVGCAVSAFTAMACQ